MALADIIAKIERDAEAEAASIVAAAEERAVAIRAQAAEQAADKRATVLAEAEEQAELEASRSIASARLAARDEGLVRRRTLVNEALEGAVEALASTSDAEYASFLARRISEVARNGDTLRLGREDMRRAESIVDALHAVSPGLTFELSDEAAPFERGAFVMGDRVQTDLSLEAIVGERRDELELAVAAILFGEGA